jgi:hypothetical protein
MSGVSASSREPMERGLPAGILIEKRSLRLGEPLKINAKRALLFEDEVPWNLLELWVSIDPAEGENAKRDRDADRRFRRGSRDGIAGFWSLRSARSHDDREGNPSHAVPS